MYVVTDHSMAVVGKSRPESRMCPATAFSVARGSFHENHQIENIL